jgi:histidinol phosphatase-like PHP family hydrolase
LQPNSKVVEINMAHNQVNEVDELLKGLKKVKGFKSYLVLNSDGIVIRWDQEDGQMSYQSAVQHGE